RRRVVPTTALVWPCRAPERGCLNPGSNSSDASRAWAGGPAFGPGLVSARRRAVAGLADALPSGRRASVRVEQLRLCRRTEPPADHLALEIRGSRAEASLGGSTGSPSQRR